MLSKLASAGKRSLQVHSTMVGGPSKAAYQSVQRSQQVGSGGYSLQDGHQQQYYSEHEGNIDTEFDKEAQMLDLINRVQMFQIASSRVNQSLLSRKKAPVFNLQFTEAFEQKGDQH